MISKQTGQRLLIASPFIAVGLGILGGFLHQAWERETAPAGIEEITAPMAAVTLNRAGQGEYEPRMTIFYGYAEENEATREGWHNVLNAAYSLGVPVTVIPATEELLNEFPTLSLALREEGTQDGDLHLIVRNGNQFCVNSYDRIPEIDVLAEKFARCVPEEGDLQLRGRFGALPADAAVFQRKFVLAG